MRIYIEMGENKLGEDELSESINNNSDHIQFLMLQKLRCEIMWALRFLEKEIEESKGIIYIRMNDLKSSPKIQLENFNDEELIIKIQEIAKKTKL